MNSSRSAHIANVVKTSVITAMLVGTCLHSVASSAGEQLSKNILTIANSDLLALGPVERVDLGNLRIQILGQVAALPASQQGIANDDLVGQMVAVYGSLNPDG